jgi:hypothetical protein
VVQAGLATGVGSDDSGRNIFNFCSRVVRALHMMHHFYSHTNYYKKPNIGAHGPIC